MFYVEDVEDDIISVKDTADGVVEKYSASELTKIVKENHIRIFGHKKSGFVEVNIEEHQQINFGNLIIHSFYECYSKHPIHFVVEDEITKRVLWVKSVGSILDDNDYVPSSKCKHDQGDLEVLFVGGRVNKCIGCAFNTSYLYTDDDYPAKNCYCEFELEYHPDGEIYEINFTKWNGNIVSAHPYHYNQWTDRIE